MELWTIGNKMTVLGLVIAMAYFSVEAPSPWFVLYVLLYLALNLAALFLKGRGCQAVNGLVILEKRFGEKHRSGCCCSIITYLLSYSVQQARFLPQAKM
ncbi:hypothetical protein [Paenibacillus macerans]|uniref:hypothetical protein n=1 Tax=Paenibacillus macerans TaxID=44252 RepID=UPI002040C80C|nr:hypothetical protein [Paenibacillus macerans]MCM3698557.1 hypothetical protein [Paenibacillus macerans]